MGSQHSRDYRNPVCPGTGPAGVEHQATKVVRAQEGTQEGCTRARTAADTERKDPRKGKGDRSTATANTTSTPTSDEEAASAGNGAMAKGPLEREMGKGSERKDDTGLVDTMGDRRPDALPGPSERGSNLGLPAALRDHWPPRLAL